MRRYFKNHTYHVWAVVLLSSMMLLSVQAQQLTAADEVDGMGADDTAVLYRQSVFYLMQVQLQQLKRQLSEADSSGEEIVVISTQLMHTAQMARNAFGEHAQGGFDIPSNSVADIWASPEAFEQAMVRLETTTEELVQAAQSGQQAQIESAFAEVAKSCKACHEDFRAK